jgi:hypothetical protein
VGRDVHQENEEYVMEKFEIVPAGRVYANQMAPHLRVSDLIEIGRASGQDALDALLDSIEVSDEDMCWCALYNKLPVAMFGANNMPTEGEPEGFLGGIWLLATPGIYYNTVDFHRCAKKYVKKMHERYEYLTNFIDADNVPTQRWLPRLGFKPIGVVPEFGVGGTPFIQFVSHRGD